MALATDSCLERLVFWWWHPPLIGGCPWVHPCGHPNTPPPPQTPFLASGTCSTTSDTVPVEKESDGAPFFRFFPSIHDPSPHPVTLCPPGEVKQTHPLTASLQSICTPLVKYPFQIKHCIKYIICMPFFPVQQT